MSRSADLPAPNSNQSWLTTPDYSARSICGKSEFIQARRFGPELEVSGYSFCGIGPRGNFRRHPRDEQIARTRKTQPKIQLPRHPRSLPLRQTVEHLIAVRMPQQLQQMRELPR